MVSYFTYFFDFVTLGKLSEDTTLVGYIYDVGRSLAIKSFGHIATTAPKPVSKVSKNISCNGGSKTFVVINLYSLRGVSYFHSLNYGRQIQVTPEGSTVWCSVVTHTP